MNNLALLVARVLLAVLFIAAGVGKFADPATTTGMIAAQGWPAAMVFTYLAAILETFGGLAILVGFQTRYLAYALALFSIVTGVVFHMGQGGDNQMMVVINQIMFLKNLAIAGGFLALATAGAGAWSLDARRSGGQLATAAG